MRPAYDNYPTKGSAAPKLSPRPKLCAAFRRGRILVQKLDSFLGPQDKAPEIIFLERHVPKDATVDLFLPAIVAYPMLVLDAAAANVTERGQYTPCWENGHNLLKYVRKSTKH